MNARLGAPSATRRIGLGTTIDRTRVHYDTTQQTSAKISGIQGGAHASTRLDDTGGQARDARA